MKVNNPYLKAKIYQTYNKSLNLLFYTVIKVTDKDIIEKPLNESKKA